MTTEAVGRGKVGWEIFGIKTPSYADTQNARVSFEHFWSLLEI